MCVDSWAFKLLENVEKKCIKCKLSFTWSKMRIAAQKTAFQMALRNCSQEAGGESQYRHDFDEVGIHVIKHVFFQKVSTSLVKPLLVSRKSRHHEGF